MHSKWHDDKTFLNEHVYFQIKEKKKEYLSLSHCERRIYTKVHFLYSKMLQFFWHFTRNNIKHLSMPGLSECKWKVILSHTSKNTDSAYKRVSVSPCFYRLIILKGYKIFTYHIFIPESIIWNFKIKIHAFWIACIV